MEKPTIVFSPLHNAVPAQGGAIDLLVRVQSPDWPVDKVVEHTPKRLALVVDRSGSMDGKPLREALKCVNHIAQNLTLEDAISIVVYDHEVDILMTISPMLSASAVEHAIENIESGGSTDLHGGWLKGAQQLEGGTTTSISRVILLSDGQANHGLTRQLEIEDQCRAWQERGVTTTTVGLGRDFNETLMMGMAQAGGGQNYYGQHAEDLFDNFDEELSLLKAMYMRKLSVKLLPAAGVIIEMISPVVLRPDGKYRMSDLAWEAESWLAIRLHVTPSAAGSMRDLLAATIDGTAMDGECIEVSAPVLQLPALDAAAYASLPVDEMVQRRLDELRFAQSSARLHELAKAGDSEAARRLLRSLEEEFSSNEWLKAKIAHLRRMTEEDMEMMSKEMQYTAYRMSNRLASKCEVAFSMDETSLNMPSFLRKKESEGRGRNSS